MGRAYLDLPVWDAALQRLTSLYAVQTNRIIVSFSAGKDSMVILELAIEAARQEGRLPVEVVMRDEEIMLPGTYEYAERTAAREEVDFHWVYANQPIVNAFNRERPYWWVFDPELPPEEWVRQPPSFAYHVPELSIDRLVTREKFPPSDDPDVGDLYVVIGLRAAESRARMFGLFSSGGWLTKETKHGYRKARPIYDWGDGDVWRACSTLGWDYNTAYDVMHRLGMKPRALRIAPPTMRAASIDILRVASRAWPRWFDRVCDRLPGVRTAAQFGRRAVEPLRRHGETWEACFHRECIDEAPTWIAERAKVAAERSQWRHRKHASGPLPQVAACPRCPLLGSWELLAKMTYCGDPFSFVLDDLPEVQPEFFRKGAGVWGGSATW